MAQGPSTNKQKILTAVPSADVTMQNAATATGNGTVLTTTGYGTAVIQVTGTFSAGITIEGTVNGSNYATIAVNSTDSTSIYSAINAVGIYYVPVAGLTNIRARISSYASGSVTVVGRATNAPTKLLTRAINSTDDAIQGYAYVDDGGGGTILLRSNNGYLYATGDVAHDSADTRHPVKVGAKATSSVSAETLVANGDRTNLYAGLDGVPITRPYTNLEDIVTGVASITDGSSTSVIAAQGAGIKVYITSVVISNSSSTSVEVDLRDGAAGSVKHTFPAPANSSSYGGVVVPLPVPIPFSANTAVCADPSAAATTIKVSLVGFKSKI